MTIWKLHPCVSLWIPKHNISIFSFLNVTNKLDFFIAVMHFLNVFPSTLQYGYHLLVIFFNLFISFSNWYREVQLIFAHWFCSLLVCWISLLVLTIFCGIVEILYIWDHSHLLVSHRDGFQNLSQIANSARAQVLYLSFYLWDFSADHRLCRAVCIEQHPCISASS